MSCVPVLRLKRRGTASGIPHPGPKRTIGPEGGTLAMGPRMGTIPP